MDLRQLTTFSTIAELGTVSAAATALHVTQPALSRQLQRLERQVGVELFHRHQRRLTLTAAGQALLGPVREVLAGAERARMLADALSTGRLERVRAAAPTTTLNDVVAPFLATLEPGDPLVTVLEASAQQAVAGLGAHLDLVVLSVPAPRGLASAPLAELPVWAYVRGDHPLAGSEHVDVAALAEHRLLALDRTSRPRTLLDEAMVRAGVSPGDVVECANPQVAQALAAAGRGVAVVSDDPRYELARALVTAAGQPLRLTLVAAWDPAHHAAPVLAALAGRLGDFCRARYPGTTPG